MNTAKWMLSGIVAAGLVSLPAFCAPQNQPPHPQSDSDMKGMDMGETQHDADRSQQAVRAANDHMSDMHRKVGVHIPMPAAGPQPRGEGPGQEKIVEKWRPAIEKYKDYHVALN